MRAVCNAAFSPSIAHLASSVQRDELKPALQTRRLYFLSNMDDLNAQFRKYAMIAAGVIVVALLAAAALSARLQRTISVPVLHLADTAQRISAEGDYSVRVERDSTDELGGLYRAFNHMLNQIEESERALQEANDHLELRVEERTARLTSEIAHREMVQSDLERARDAAEAANRAKSAFLANMSHEIRTPLNAILGFTELLLRGAASDQAERDDYLQTIHTSGKHLLSLISDILDLSKIEAGRLVLERVACSPHAILAESVSVMRARAQEKGLTLEYQWRGPMPESVESDPARLRQLLLNLIGNAIKFTRQGGVRILAGLTLRGNRYLLVIDVIDTGIGIAPEKLKTIFDPFVQADTSVTREFGGTGLGLAISRRIAEALGGEVRVESEPGKGSMFTIAVDCGPLDNVRFLDAPVADALDGRPPPTADSPEAADLSSLSVLLVEDGETNRKLISLMLRRAGAKVTTAENGQVGVQLAARERFDVILMDMQMPVMDGYTAARRLREMQVRVPIIALTAHAMKGDEEKCREAGCSGYLTKPAQAETLLSTVAAAVRAVEKTPSKAAEAASAAPARTLRGPAMVSTLPLDDEEFREIVEEFIARLHEKLAEMDALLEAGNLAELAHSAHWLKGAGGTAGFAPFTEPARRLETAAKQADRERLPKALGELHELADRIVMPAAT